MRRRTVLLSGSVSIFRRAATGAMPTKLDPVLAAMLEDPALEADREVTVMIGLAAAPTERTLAELRALGLSVRSVVGDVLTGSARLGRIVEISAHPAIVRIEAATPLHPEDTPRQAVEVTRAPPAPTEEDADDQQARPATRPPERTRGAVPRRPDGDAPLRPRGHGRRGRACRTAR